VKTLLNILWICCGLLPCHSAIAQTDTAIAYFDGLFRQQPDLRTASYYGVVRKPSPAKFEVTFFNFDNELVGLGEYRSKRLKNRHGIFLRYGANQSIILTANFAKGLLNGDYQLFHPNNILADSGRYIRNRPIGLWKSWYANGQLKETKQYVLTNGRFGADVTYLQDEYKSWFENGRLKDSGYYKNNFRDGVWVEWLQNGQMRSIGAYRKGWKSGTWKFYDNKGKLLYMRRFSNIRYDREGELIEVKE